MNRAPAEWPGRIKEDKDADIQLSLRKVRKGLRTPGRGRFQQNFPEMPVLREHPGEEADLRLQRRGGLFRGRGVVLLDGDLPFLRHCPKLSKKLKTKEEEMEIQLNDANFDQEVIQSDLPVLVDFWAPWCAPCKMIAPVLVELAGDYAGRLKVAKLNVDDGPGTARTYGIQGIPTLVLFRGGREVERFVGALPKQVLADKLDTLL